MNSDFSCTGIFEQNYPNIKMGKIKDAMEEHEWGFRIDEVEPPKKMSEIFYKQQRSRCSRIGFFFNNPNNQI